MLKGTAMQRPVPTPAHKNRWQMAPHVHCNPQRPSLPPKLEIAKVSLNRETLCGSPPEERNTQVTRLSDVAAKEQFHV